VFLSFISQTNAEQKADAGMRSGKFSHKPDLPHALKARLRHSATCDSRSKPYAEKDEYFGSGSKYQFCKSDCMSKASGSASHRIATNGGRAVA
jgi:hypothetical protein